jgi:transcriptional regulator with XRE-family HTH domain
MKTITEQLKQTRIANGLSQKEFGIKLNLPQSHISAIEAGKVDPRLTSITEMARVLRLELMLVPLSLVPAVRSMLAGDSNKPLWSIDGEEEESEDHEEEVE